MASSSKKFPRTKSGNPQDRVMSPKVTIKQEKNTSRSHILSLLIILLVTFLVYVPVLKSEFINWDDSGYVRDNVLIKELSVEKIKEIFSANVMGNYQPITILGYALQYHFYENEPNGYHLVNVLLHLIAVTMVYIMILKLSGKIPVAFVAAFIFGVHPMHVESVAWVSGMKDMLYGSFFCASVITYISYLKKKEKGVYYYALSLFFFILSILSKGMAVSLPVVLICTDYLVFSKLRLKNFLDKIPFFLLSLIFGLLAFYFQKSEDAIQGNQTYHLFDRVVFASYGFCMYLFKFILPFNLSGFYPYPLKNSEGFLAFWYYLFPLITAFILYIIFRAFRKQNLIFVYGFAVYIITVFLVLQLIPVGSAVMADRYTYLPYIGIALLVGHYWQKYSGNNSPLTVSTRYMLNFILILFLCTITVSGWSRVKIWKNAGIFWSDMLSKYPNLSYAYANRGQYYYNDLKDKDKALADYNQGVTVDPRSYHTFKNRGFLHYKEGEIYKSRGDFEKAGFEFEQALSDFNKTISLKDDFDEAYNNRGSVYFSTNKFDSAIMDYTKAILLNKRYAETYGNRANAYSVLKKFDLAWKDYDVFLGYFPNHKLAYYWRGLAKFNLGETNGALNDYNKAITLEPKFAAAYLDRSRLLLSQNRKNEALKDAIRAKELGAVVEDEYIKQLQ
ncbi:MAG: hypothetical protein A3H98_10495 [Bacteroidetes bacterium RIFCSPLOWO2_02_FULL_36_8]|nr:MAG: hypothetical protein A3H98_10495 [Bacteroidetes bacterium RIFCSPLOWO2_02_FULL_36_8]OFY70931.1 MAG: hypothetical protein A3G23_12495 [Bacteroidetes bacterium RIFCSPLOWO2_12_FULL_37_12]